MRLAKTETKSDIDDLDEMLSEVEKDSGFTPQSVKFVPLIESAKGIVDSFEIASSSRRVVAVAFGAEDYYRDLGRDINLVSGEEAEQ